MASPPCLGAAENRGGERASARRGRERAEGCPHPGITRRGDGYDAGGRCAGRSASVDARAQGEKEGLLPAAVQRPLCPAARANAGAISRARGLCCLPACTSCSTLELPVYNSLAGGACEWWCCEAPTLSYPLDVTDGAWLLGSPGSLPSVCRLRGGV